MQRERERERGTQNGHSGWKNKEEITIMKLIKGNPIQLPPLYTSIYYVYMMMITGEKYVGLCHNSFPMTFPIYSQLHCQMRGSVVDYEPY